MKKEQLEPAGVKRMFFHLVDNTRGTLDTPKRLIINPLHNKSNHNYHTGYLKHTLAPAEAKLSKQNLLVIMLLKL